MKNDNKGKYSTPEGEQEVLPNLLGLTSVEEMGEAELVGFLWAQEAFVDALDENTVFV